MTIKNIQVLRFIAAAMVLFSHVQHELYDQPQLSQSGIESFNPVFWAGGVDIFFVISGFIMYYISYGEFGAKGASSKFAYRRFVRVVPIYWIFTTAMIAAVLLFPKQIAHTSLSIWHILASYLFVPWPNGSGDYYPILILGWTLNFEIFFYAIFALSIHFKKPTGLVILVSILAFVAISGFFGVQLPIIKFWANPIVLEFLFGVYLAHMKLKSYQLPRSWGLALIVTGVVIMMIMELTGIAGGYWTLRPFWMGIPAFLICAGAILMPETANPGPIKRVFVFGGDVSYALYLSHPFSIGLAVLLLEKANVHGQLFFMFAASAFSLVAAVAVYYFLERPLLELARSGRLRKGKAVLST